MGYFHWSRQRLALVKPSIYTLDFTRPATRVKQRVLRLRQALQELVRIDGDPILYSKRAATYSCQFDIRLAADGGFRAPAGTTWLDLALHERVDGRIVITVPEKRGFQAYGSDSPAGRKSREVAERVDVITRTYSMEEMGFRTDRGSLTEEGKILLEFLRSGGTVDRRHSDMSVLKLARQLREWTALEGDPLRLANTSRRWTAVFACSSAISCARRS